MNKSRDQEIGRQFAKISAATKSIPEHDRLGYIKGALLAIEDEVLRHGLEDLLITFSGADDIRRHHIVVLVHGIATRALWFEPLAELLNQIPNVSTKRLYYGYFDVIRFLIPFLRKGPIDRLRTQLALISRDNERANVSVIAHSFGTYAVTKILADDAAIRLFRLVLCGSVVDRRFAWHKMAGLVEKQPIINECGELDIWPLLAASSTWGYGASGTYGFEHQATMDRFHRLSHSGFFSPHFFESYWIPLWANADASPQIIAAPRTGTPPLLQIAGRIPLKWIVLIVIVLACFYVAHS
jgi:hypothetical protein